MNRARKTSADQLHAARGFADIATSHDKCRGAERFLVKLRIARPDFGGCLEHRGARSGVSLFVCGDNRYYPRNSSEFAKPRAKTVAKILIEHRDARSSADLLRQRVNELSILVADDEDQPRFRAELPAAEKHRAGKTLHDRIRFFAQRRGENHRWIEASHFRVHWARI